MGYQVDREGFYGEFGGAYVPEMLYPNIRELEEKYLAIIGSDAFRKEFRGLLEDYAGRPTPLFEAARLSEQFGTRIFLKREDKS
jgi:tryptophan synthase beta chain